MQQRRHIKSFDGLRAIGSLAVLFYHLNPGFLPQGYFGVVFFFVLAGFLNVRQVLMKDDQLRSRMPLPWIVRRLARLLPPLLLMLLTVTLIMILNPGYTSFLTRYPSALLSSLFGVNHQVQIAMNVSYFETHGYIRPLLHMWALSLELQFYIVFALTFHKLYQERDRLKWSLICLVATVVSLVVFIVLALTGQVDTAYYSLVARFHAFSLGGLAALAAVYRPKVDKTSAEASKQWTGLNVESVPQPQNRRVLGQRGSISELLGAVLLFVLVVSMFIPMEFEVGVTYGLPISALLFTLLVVVVQEDRGRVALFLRFKPFPWIASRSYEIFLWHTPIIVFLMYEMGKTRIPLFLRSIVCLVLSFIVAEIFYRIPQAIRAFHKRHPQSRSLVASSMAYLAVFIVLFVSSVTLFIFQPEDTELMELQRRIEAQEALLTVGGDGENGNPAISGEANITDSSVPTDGANGQGLVANSEEPTGDESTSENDSTSSSESETSSESISQSEPESEHTSETETTPSLDPATTDEATLIETYLADPAQTDAYQYFKEWFYLGGDYLMSQADYNAVRDIPLTIIGDSLGVGISYATDVFLPNSTVYAKSNRFLSEGPGIIQELINLGALNDPVLLMLGSNGEIDRADLETIYELVGDRQLMICTIVLPDGTTEARRNNVIKTFVNDRPDVKLVDWYDQAKGIPEIFIADLTHLTIPGARAYVQLITSALVDLYANP